jgi:hypothetical protein
MALTRYAETRLSSSGLLRLRPAIMEMGRMSGERDREFLPHEQALRLL